MRTIDGVEITPGLIVWDYDLRVSEVAGPDPAYGDGWFRMVNPFNGNQQSAMSHDRMWVRHPSNGQPASEVDVASE